MIKHIASLSLIATVLLLSGCYHHHGDDGWRDGDHRHHPRHHRDRDHDRDRDRDRDRYYR